LVATCANCGADSPERAKFCLECGAPLAWAQQPERFRRTVTILFSDVVGSTSLGERLDPESLSGVMSEYFAAVRPVAERHGGTVAKFIGDAVMAVFGLVELHEDDSLRAARAAVEMRETLARLNPELQRRYGVVLATRTGINTGPVAGEGLVPDRNFVAGDTANTAARLQTAAGENEILLSQTTYRVVRDAVEAELLPPLRAKGKAAPLTVYRLVAVLADEERTARRLETPLVGRQSELAELEWALRRCAEEESCRLVTVVGPPGVGKSRLVREFVARAESQARVLRSRCLPYGDGITYWPLGQMVRQAARIEESDSVADAIVKLRAVAPSEPVAERVAQAIGLVPGDLAGKETPWAFRRLFEALAAARPLVCVCDDVQWAEPALLELLTYLSSHVHDGPVLLCCLARTELLDARPDWPGVVRLTSLAGAESDLLLTKLLGSVALPVRLRERIAQAAEGNPLFIEQLAAMLVDDGLLADPVDEREPHDLVALPIPPSVHALLAARLDRLEPNERHLLTRAAVIGQVFYRGALDELAAASLRPQVDSVLLALVRKDFVVPSRSDVGGEEAFAFRHLLIRDAAYEALTKQDRADLHERFALWFERRFAGRLEEVEEILGYHLEQAYRLRTELRPLDDQARALASGAAARLAASGRRAAARSDPVAAVTLLGRAAGLLAPDDPVRAALLVRLSDELVQCGRLGEADAALTEAIASAASEPARQLARLRLFSLKLRMDPHVDVDSIEAEARRAADDYAAVGDDEVAAAAWDVLAFIAMGRNHFADLREAGTRLSTHYRRAGDPRWVAGVQDQFFGAYHGSEPTAAAIALGERTLEALRGHPSREASVLGGLATLHAMRGEFAIARELALRGRSIFEELGASLLVNYITVESIGWYVEAFSGDWEAAERELRRGYEGLAAMNETGVLSSAAGHLAVCLLAQGRDDEAAEFIAVCADNAATDDVSAQIQWRCARAKLLARRGEAAEAEALAVQATELVRPTDCLDLQADTLLDLAEVLRLLGKHEPARAAAAEAYELYRRKEHLVGVACAQELLAQLDVEVSTR
jgi:class 3 adenylate cyclase/tetratricopeptide (TPR) repeat protein